MTLLLADEIDFFARDDLAEDLGVAVGLDSMVNALYRRFGTPRGTQPSPVDPPDPRDADDGNDLTELLALGQTPAGVFAIQSAVKGEVLKEAYVDPASVKVAVSLDTSIGAAAAKVTIDITGTTLDGQPFALTLDVSAFSSAQGGVAALVSGPSQ